jgi:hypothetical protein
MAALESITKEFPVWQKDLRIWTKKLLLAMDLPESRAAASTISD